MNARELALSVVRDVFPSPRSSAPERGAQESLDYRARRADASGRDRAFATELAYGSIKMRRALDWYLEPFVGERAQTLPDAIREILRLAVFELVYTQADAHATVFEFVNLAKRYGHRGLANLVNAVLRSFLRERPGVPEPARFENTSEYLATRYSLPTWIVRQWRETFGDEGAEEVCSAVNDPARAALTVNALKNARDEVAGRLQQAGVETTPSPVVPESLLLDKGGGSVHALESQARGAWWTQSESSAMAVEVLNPQPGEAILDVCSGRGNKALQIGARLSGEGTLLCLERDARKAAILARRLDEGGVAAGIVIGDATASAVLPPEQRFDRILIDAPCSGTGVIGRHPEARWKKEAADGERLAATQRTILERAARQVGSGGALVYAVCSTDPRETTDVVRGFLSGENFERGLVPAACGSFLTAEGDVLVRPGIAGRDGFFIARLEHR
jgi:16S rRNA (cytosine967-C5)-methyltransferase